MDKLVILEMQISLEKSDMIIVLSQLIVLKETPGIHSSSFVFCQCHNSHTEAPSTEERGSGAVEAAVCVRFGCRMSKLFTGLARGPLLTVNQVCKFFQN